MTLYLALVFAFFMRDLPRQDVVDGRPVVPVHECRR
jgi:hypothetical protein